MKHILLHVYYVHGAIRDDATGEEIAERAIQSDSVIAFPAGPATTVPDERLTVADRHARDYFAEAVLAGRVPFVAPVYDTPPRRLVLVELEGMDEDEIPSYRVGTAWNDGVVRFLDPTDFATPEAAKAAWPEAIYLPGRSR